MDLEFEHLHQPDGWLSPGMVQVGPDGRISAVHQTAPAGWSPAERMRGFAVPGMPNLHSHAFQRALAGRTEHREGHDGGDDNLWTWRRAMYRFVARLGPDDLGAIAALAYLELVRGGFTAVGEFHYLHLDPDGGQYVDLATMAWSIVDAATEVGIGLTVMPVLYRHAGPGRAVAPEQLRFVLAADDVVEIAGRIRARPDPLIDAGIAPHSLRAVGPDEIADLVASWRSLDGGSVHIHVAERPEEVAEVEAAYGSPPIRLLLDRIGIDSAWCLVHATHGTADELAAVAASGATIALCPVTEATVADGLFPLVDYAANAGRWGIGTDSNYATEVAAELRSLELGQRLREGRRNPLVRATSGPFAHAGRVLFDAALSVGQNGLDQAVGAVEPGNRADIVILDGDGPILAGHGTSSVLDAWLLSGGTSPVRDVMIGGRWIVRDGHHPAEVAILDRYRRTMARLAESL